MADAEAPTIWHQGNLSIREWQTKDIESSIRHLNDKRVWDKLRNRIPHPYTEADAKWWINFCHDPANKVKSGKWTPENGSEGPLVPPNFAIVVDGEAVGGISLSFADEKDIYFHGAELGYWLGEEHWGKGVMTKVVPAFVEWAWKTFDILIRISAETNEPNVASGKILQKAGFEYEGRRPDMVCKNGKIGAILLWGALRDR